MEKVYLLLRNNIESGPFTIQELLQQQLKPSDMIWVEGKSTAWTYLNEMELNFHGEETIESVSEPKPSRKTGDEIEQKAEEIRKRALSYRPKPLMVQADPASDFSNYSRGFMNPDDSIEIINHKKEKNKTVNEVIMTSVIICLFAGGLYAGSTFLHSRKEIISPAATRVTPPKRTVPAKQEINNQPVRNLPSPFITTTGDSIDQHVANQTESKIKTNYNAFALKSKMDSSKQITAPVQPITVDVNEEEVSAPLKLPVTDVNLDVSDKKEEPKKKEEPVKKEPADSNKKKITEKKDKAEDEDKKKGLGEALKGIFKKKKKNEKQDN